MKIRWSPRAADDLERIFLYIQRDNPAAALRTIRRLHAGIGSLAKSPYRGRPGRIPGTRELLFSPLPFIVQYRVAGDVIEVGQIYHGAQDRP